MHLNDVAPPASNEPAYPGIPATLALTSAHETSLQDDIDALLNNMEMPVQRSSVLDDDMNLHITASMMSSVYFNLLFLKGLLEV